jgi:hypothetical protein
MPSRTRPTQEPRHAVPRLPAAVRAHTRVAGSLVPAPVYTDGAKARLIEAARPIVKNAETAIVRLDHPPQEAPQPAHVARPDRERYAKRTHEQREVCVERGTHKALAVDQPGQERSQQRHRERERQRRRHHVPQLVPHPPGEPIVESQPSPAAAVDPQRAPDRLGLGGQLS